MSFHQSSFNLSEIYSWKGETTTKQKNEHHGIFSLEMFFLGESVENFRVKLLLSCEVVGWACGLMMFGLGFLVANGRFVIGTLFDELLGASIFEVNKIFRAFRFYIEKILKLFQSNRNSKAFPFQSMNLRKANFKHSWTQIAITANYFNPLIET